MSVISMLPCGWCGLNHSYWQLFVRRCVSTCRTDDTRIHLPNGPAEGQMTESWSSTNVTSLLRWDAPVSKYRLWLVTHKANCSLVTLSSFSILLNQRVISVSSVYIMVTGGTLQDLPLWLLSLRQMLYASALMFKAWQRHSCEVNYVSIHPSGFLVVVGFVVVLSLW